jgi:hypothetical protein
MALAVTNFAATATTAAVEQTDTVLPVVTTAGFPSLGSGEFFMLALGEPPTVELAKCTAVGVNRLVLVRGQEGTPARSWPAGTTVRLVVSAAALAEFVQRSGATMTGPLVMAAPDGRLNFVDGAVSSQIRQNVLTDSTRSEVRLRFDGTPPAIPPSPPPGFVQRTRFEFGRLTNAASGVALVVFKGDGSGDGAHAFYGYGDAHLAIPAGRKVGIGTENPVASLHIARSDAIVIPAGTTAQRPSSPVEGMIRYNTETDQFEGYANGQWSELGAAGSELAINEVERVEVVDRSSGATLTVADMLHRLSYTDNVLRRLERIVRITGTGPVSCTLPNGASGVLVGHKFFIRNGSNDVLTINAPSGSTINGEPSVVVPWSQGEVYLEATAVADNNVTWFAVGDTTEGVTLPATRARGAVRFDATIQGGTRLVRSTITASTTLSVTDDVNVIRHVNGSGITVTVPSTYVGVCDLWADTAFTLAFQGGSSYSIAAGERAVVDVHKYDNVYYRRLYKPVPV